MKTHASTDSLEDYLSGSKEGCYTILGENIMVIDEEFISDLRDMGYLEIEFEDLLSEYYDWVEDVTA